MGHWTNESADNFRYRIASDFIEQLRAKTREKHMSQTRLAAKSGVSEGRISQLFNNPGNLTLDTIVRLARAVGMKVSVVAYDDGDSKNERGPIFSEVFAECWRRQGKPQDNWDLNPDAAELSTPASQEVGSVAEGNPQT